MNQALQAVNRELQEVRSTINQCREQENRLLKAKKFLGGGNTNNSTGRRKSAGESMNTMLEALREGPMTKKEMQAKTNLPAYAIHSGMKKLSEATPPKVEKTGAQRERSNEWRITEAVREMEIQLESPRIHDDPEEPAPDPPVEIPPVEVPQEDGEGDKEAEKAAQEEALA